jgi:Cu(I)/Ag(I) efflux system membrane fusion protein
MQGMMGQIGMADWQMRGAREAKMEGMEGMEGMKVMPGMKPAPAKPVSETRQVAGLSLTLTPMPETPKAGETVRRLKVTDQAGKPITEAQVVFSYTMPMPGMMESKVTAMRTKDGVYEGKAMLGMGGMWEVTVDVARPGHLAVTEKFQFVVAGGGM